jgi:hypothetical protein
MRFEDETFVVGHDSDPLDPAEIRPEDLKVVCLSCLIERHPVVGRGMDLAREGGVACYSEGAWSVGR